MEQLDQMILLNVAEDVCRQQVGQNPEILEGSPQYIKSGYQKVIQYDKSSSRGGLQMEEKKDDEVRNHPDIIKLGQADTQWFSLPEDMGEKINLIRKGAAALAQSLNQIREHMEYQNGMKLKTARTLCEMEFGKDKRYPPRIRSQPADEDIRLVVRHALRPR